MKKILLLIYVLLVAFGVSAQNHWVPNIHQFPTNMNVIATIEVNGIEQRNGFLELGVFCGEECRGSQILDYYDDPLDRYLLFLTAYGENGDPFTFRLYDHLTHQELSLSCSNEMSYLSNDIIGQLFEPYVFVFSGGGDCSVEVAVDPEGSGEVAGMGNVPCGSYCTLTATPLNDNVFLGWLHEGVTLSTDMEYSFHVLSDISLIAHFQAPAPIPVYHVSVSASPVEGGIVDGEDDYEEGSVCEVTALANEGYLFQYWMEGDEIVSEEFSYEFEVYADRDLVACFVEVIDPEIYQITASVDPVEGGEIVGAGTYIEGELCSLMVNLNPYYEFVNWTENGVVVSTENPYVFQTNESRSLIANVVYVNGVEDDEIHDAIYPNPTNGVLWVRGGDAGTVAVYDMNGRKVFTTDERMVDLSGLAEGVYYVSVAGRELTKVVLRR